MKFSTLCLLAILSGLGITAMATADELSDIERDAKALELYLQDRNDHQEYCPHIEWFQPPIGIYKDLLSSQLPQGCKD